MSPSTPTPGNADAGTITATERVAIDTLRPYPGNARTHNLDVIMESLTELGQYRQVVAQESTRTVLAGNGTMEAALALGWTHLDVTWVDVDDTHARKIVAVDNRSNDVAGYDDALLADLLKGIPDLAGTGYDDDFLTNLLDGLAQDFVDAAGPAPQEGEARELNPRDDPDSEAGLGAEGGESDGRAPDAGTLLMLADISIAAPTYTPTTGQVWELGPHVLVISKVHTGWEQWVGFLQPGALFVPYPGPYTALTTTADKAPLVLVQPDVYMAGHVLQKYAAIHGADSVKVRS